MSTTLVNYKITIALPKKNKQMGFYTTIEEKNSDYLRIKAINSEGERRGNVGRIYRSGKIEAKDNIIALITPELKKKIDLMLDLVYGISRINSAKLVRKELAKCQPKHV